MVPQRGCPGTECGPNWFCGGPGPVPATDPQGGTRSSVFSLWSSTLTVLVPGPVAELLISGQGMTVRGGEGARAEHRCAEPCSICAHSSACLGGSPWNQLLTHWAAAALAHHCLLSSVCVFPTRGTRPGGRVGASVLFHSVSVCFIQQCTPLIAGGSSGAWTSCSESWLPTDDHLLAYLETLAPFFTQMFSSFGSVPLSEIKCACRCGSVSRLSTLRLSWSWLQ